MIKISANEGELHISGSIDDVLTEYTIVTQAILKQMEETSDKDKAFKALAALGRVAVEDYNKPLNAQKIYDNVDKVITDELQI